MPDAPTPPRAAVDAGELRRLLGEAKPWVHRPFVLSGAHWRESAAMTAYLVAAANALPSLLDERDALLAALRAVEWGAVCAATEGARPICPACHCVRAGGHAAECAIGAALAGGVTGGAGRV